MVSELAAAPHEVNNSVINALLEAFYDVLDLDGKRSILAAAGLETLMENKLPPDEFSSSSLLNKLLFSMRNLLQFSDRVLFEIGRKFSIYFDPSGSSFEEFIALLNNQFHDIQLSIAKVESDVFEINMQSIESKMSLFTDPWMRYFYQGILEEGLRKSIGGQISSELTGCDEECICFRVKITYE